MTTERRYLVKDSKTVDEMATTIKNRLRPKRLVAKNAMKGVRWEIGYMEKGDKNPDPVLVATPPFYFQTTGKRIFVTSVPLITRTSKMAAGSFSLPAGPPGVNGTCAASAQKPVSDGSHYLCYDCYATKGHYTMYTHAAVRQIARKEWVHKLFARGRPDLFVDSMVDGLKLWFSCDRFYVDMKRNIRVPMDPHYFRIHDSGDFAWQPGYYEAWVKIATRFPKVKFWAPTRDWIFNGIANDQTSKLKNAPTTNEDLAYAMRQRRPKNLIIRPSSLFFGDDPPEVPWMDAGTTSSQERHKVNNPKQHWLVGGNVIKPWCGMTSRGTGLCRCPAYESEEANCASAGCRTCWEKPDREVVYPRHTKKAMRTGAIKPCAPKASLKNLLASYMSTRTNPVPVHDQQFAGWLLRHGHDPDCYSEFAWTEALGLLGWNDDQIGDYLEASAEAVEMGK